MKVARETREALLAVALGVVFVAAFAATACAPGWDDPNPAATAATRYYPCGPMGQVCDVMPRWQDDTCCDQNDVCPGPHAGDCTPGQCCFGADFDPSPQYGDVRGDAGAHGLRIRAPVRRAQ